MNCACGFLCSKRTTVRTFILYDENKKVFLEVYVFYPATSPIFFSSFYGCESRFFSSVFHDGEYSNETKIVMTRLAGKGFPYLCSDETAIKAVL